jgi:hypothetical protein
MDLCVPTSGSGQTRCGVILTKIQSFVYIMVGNEIVLSERLGSATARARGIFQQKNIRALREELFCGRP